MKTKIFFIVMLLGFFISCNSDETHMLILQNDVTWENQLDYVINGKGAEFLKAQGLELESYEKKEQKALINELTLKSIIPFYSDTTNINNYDICEISRIKGFDPVNIVRVHSQRKKAILESHPKTQFTTIELNWSYNNMLFTTECIVDNTGVIYDDILSNIIYTEIICSDEVKVLHVKTRSESSSIKYNYYTNEYVQRNMWNKVAAKAFCSITVKGEFRNGMNMIDSYEKSIVMDSDPGFSAVADVKIISFSRGDHSNGGGYCEFECGAMVGSTSNLTLGWNGSSFTIPGGGFGMSFGKWVNASDLK